MSRTFYAKDIFVLDETAHGTGHDGLPYTNSDYPKDTVICVDEDGNVYRYNDMFHEGGVSSRSAEVWPDREAEGIPLFRNYWRWLYDSHENQGPYYQSITNAKRTTVPVVEVS
jgi:hypothetical protein